MRLSFLSVSVFLAVPLLVGACEGDCITDTTAAMRTNYENPVHYVLEDIAQKIIDKLLPGSTESPSALIQPLLAARHIPRLLSRQVPTNGIDPKGCPNPDCPVVCGTPGSIERVVALAATSEPKLATAAGPHLCFFVWPPRHPQNDGPSAAPAARNVKDIKAAIR
ncbi:hypothetical protein K438DRAFT_1832043, partial [Mycena galopus ATCC 62051]